MAEKYKPRKYCIIHQWILHALKHFISLLLGSKYRKGILLPFFGKIPERCTLEKYIKSIKLQSWEEYSVPYCERGKCQ